MPRRSARPSREPNPTSSSSDDRARWSHRSAPFRRRVRAHDELRQRGTDHLLAAADAVKFLLVGAGTGIWSFLHVDDAAAATAIAVEGGEPGIYNVVDNEPAEIAEWLPHLATCVGAKPPRRISPWLARPAVGEVGTSLMTLIRGSSNAKAKRDLAWEPRWKAGARASCRSPSRRCHRR
jgi:nucleoside-diphosphate-sugar epimerase